MAAITKENISNEQLAWLVLYFSFYREILNKDPNVMLSKLGIAKRALMKKHISAVNKLYKELDDL